MVCGGNLVERFARTDHMWLAVRISLAEDADLSRIHPIAAAARAAASERAPAPARKGAAPPSSTTPNALGPASHVCAIATAAFGSERELAVPRIVIWVELHL